MTYFIPLSIFFFLFFMQAYYAIMFCILFIGFYELVVMNKKYNYLKRYIEDFF